jgi:hypothetical protein
LACNTLLPSKPLVKSSVHFFLMPGSVCLCFDYHFSFLSNFIITLHSLIWSSHLFL